jgi:hypothetical protein
MPNRRAAALVVPAIVAALAASAYAGKPSAKDAVKAAKAWRTAANAEKSPAAIDATIALTGSPFWFVPQPNPDAKPADAKTPDPCSPGPVSDPAQLRAVLDCFQGSFIDDLAYGERAMTWKAIAVAQLPKPMRAQRKELAALAKTHVLVLETVSIPAPALGFALYAVGRGPDGTLRIDAALLNYEYQGQ